MKTYVIPEYIIERDEKRCIRCKVCVNQCTYDTHFYDEETDTVCSKEENCVNCQRCVTFCPTHAITIRRNPNVNRENANWTFDAIRDVKKQAENGAVILTGMGCDKPGFTFWDKLLLNASQVTNPSIDPLREPMEIRTYLGAKPDKLELEIKNSETILKTQLTPQLCLDTPIMFSAMSYGAISLNVHESLARAATECGTYFNAGEGGLDTTLYKYGDHTIVQVASGTFQLVDNMHSTVIDSLPDLVKLEHFIYEIGYDRLIGDYVSDLKTFPKHLMEVPYKNIRVVDLKGIKEINDEYSIASGDKAIYAVWMKIKESLSEEQLAKVSCFKRGGLFVICDNFDTNEAQSAILGNDLDINVQINGVQHNFNLATSSWSNSTEYKFKDEKEVAAMLGETITKSEDIWFKNHIITENITHPEYFEKKPIQAKEQIRQEHIDISQPDIFIRMFLYGKREEERTSKAIYAIDSLLDELNDSEKAKNLLEKNNLTFEEFKNNLEKIRQNIKSPKSQTE